MHYFRIPGIKSPKFVIGDRAIITIEDPDEGTFKALALISGMTWRGNHWDYAVIFEGKKYTDEGFTENELTPLKIPGISHPIRQRNRSSAPSNRSKAKAAARQRNRPGNR
ncbi:hypothetical protein NG791_16860 [Laspinema sp. D1]|uniref:hypothetical protein n=1 Tax=Laspinema palackyanum TaxID=3231601 RepID=UPI003495903D|nr:hypothetical protein [Laspinema sp. D2b]